MARSCSVVWSQYQIRLPSQVIPVGLPSTEKATSLAPCVSTRLIVPAL